MKQSKNGKMEEWKVGRLRSPAILPFRHSSIPPFQSSIIPSFHHSNIPFLLFFLVSLLFLTHTSFATHNRAGEITYRHLGADNSLDYEITITTYTKTSSCGAACRPTLDSVHLGDGSIEQFIRSQEIFLPGDITINVYVKTHTYPGEGTYKIYFIDPNRNAGVINVPNSVGVPFCIFSVLVISSNMVPRNDSPILLNPPIDSGCVGVPFIHNPIAIDADTDQLGHIIHDSLSYQLTVCLGDGGLPIPGYTFPHAFHHPSSFTIDAHTGDLVWDSPDSAGEYNAAFIIIEWRGGRPIDTIERDMQIRIIPGCNNDQPQIAVVSDTCVLAGDSIGVTVTAFDPDKEWVTDTAIGDVFPPYIPLANNPALWDPGPRNGINDTVTGLFSWRPNCSQVRGQPYRVEFKASDKNFIATLVNLKGMNITVIGPAPGAPTANPIGPNMDLHWSPDSCTNILGYHIYRHQGLFTGIIQCPCQTGVPSGTGFSLIGTNLKGANDTAFIDTNNGQGLDIGILYCYMITAIFHDGSESCASPQGCALLKKDLPVITNVTIDSTSLTAGIDTVIWSKPSELDTALFPAPYQYKIWRDTGFVGANFVLIDSLPDLNDTIYMDKTINTDARPLSYKIELYYDSAGSGKPTTFKGHSQTASSVFLTLTPTDKKMILTWEEHVPWTNYRYDIFRFDSTLQTWDSIGNTTKKMFADSGLVNGDTVCYYVRSVGTYATPGIKDTLINLSERECSVPIDNVPPCPPSLVVTADCINNNNFLQWNNPNHSCATDVLKYNIYYAADSTLDFVPLATINDANDTTFTHEHITSLAACYKVTAVDSVNNESAANIVCVDTCRQYVLPSVFTPNGDGDNDIFHPCDSTTATALQKKNCPAYKNVKDVEMKIYNRWGGLVYETTNRDINWDGKNKDSKGDCPDGVYFYTCKVNFFRLKGTETKELHGYIHLIRGKS